jgi:MYXO-CTERM domain-containing protein
MRLVIARCSVDYVGRLSAHLPSAVRLIMVKADGCVAIHADGGAYKPLNWMVAPCTLAEGEGESDGDGTLLPPVEEPEEEDPVLNIAGSAVYAACSSTAGEPALPLLGLLLLGLRRRRR